MKCREFEFDLSDWVAGRMDADHAAGMRKHADACHACSAAADDERRLRAAISAVPSITRTPDLWLRVSDRIAAPATPSTWLERLFPRPARLGYGLTFASGVAVVAVCATVFVRTQSPVIVRGTDNPPRLEVANDVNESHVVNLVETMQRSPEPGSEMGLAAPPSYSRIKDALLPESPESQGE